MIRLVEIQNWRAYRDAAIDLGSTVVFFVAPNGVGKSSLVEAVRWCLLGQPAPRQAKAAVRLGALSATVTVHVDFDDGEAGLVVTRSLTAAGKVSFGASLDGEPLSEVDYQVLLAERWAADLGLIDRLIFTDPHLPSNKSAFPVREHLASTLGVTPLLETASELGKVLKVASDDVADLRKVVAEAESELGELDDTTASNQTAFNAVVEQRRQVVVDIAAAEADVAAAARWTAFRGSVKAHNDRVRMILDELAGVIEVDVDAPAASLSTARTEAAASLKEVREQAAAQEIFKARSAGASELLAEPAAMCPTCLRPLSEHERLDALASHENTITTVDFETPVAAEAEQRANEQLERLTSFATRLAGLQEPDPPRDPDPGPDAEQTLASLRESDLALAEQVGRLDVAFKADAERATLSEHLAQGEKLLTAKANEEQLLTTTIAVLNNLADKTLRDRINPLIAELSSRWKLLFGTDGLTLEPSGELAIESTAGSLGIADLSGGERASALIIARLLITAATTKISTVWFDEPLEHLDPRRRAAVARTIVRAGQTGTVAQLVVTTYEDRIARQLAAADPEHVRVVHAERPGT